MLVIMNLLIAIMSDTYAKFNDLRTGLYFRGMIRAIPGYKYDSRYGCLVTAVPPLNILLLPLIPFFMIMKNDAVLK